MRLKLRDYKHQVETEQRLPPELVEEFREAGFYSLVMPRSLGGLQADPLTYQRVVELLAEGLGCAGWNVANNGVGDHHHVDPAGLDIGQQLLQGRAVEIPSGISRVVIVLGRAFHSSEAWLLM